MHLKLTAITLTEQTLLTKDKCDFQNYTETCYLFFGIQRRTVEFCHVEEFH